ncbi:conserved hypothetical protein [Pseudomonas sp. OF001]|uniref:hypothetical protein n=1 Tax=Pseudomonas sp. OF001 TaxID=2772300 RepID=UPI00191B6EFA|nr:hypothetical protein [Pseudomonas sp. OF001]CAD5376753.1 conserved hypothetical protein [Pseudomonas sp. OF001]
MKTITYTASSELGARSLAVQDGHLGEPLKVSITGDGYALTYQRKSRAAVLFELRCRKVRKFLEGFAHRRVCDQQSAILRAMR